MNKFISALSISCLALTTWISTASAEPLSFDLEASVGMSSDSNVSLDALDLTSRNGDQAVNTAVKFGVDKKMSTKFKGSVGYSLSDISYLTYSAFDLRTGLASALLSYSLASDLKLGVGLYHVSSDLNGSEYLSMTRWNPFLSWFSTKKDLVRFNVSQSDKQFALRPLRDATANSFGARWFHFFDGASDFISMGYDFKQEDAVDAMYDYSSHTLKLSWTKKFPILGQSSKFRTGMKIEMRDYDSIASGISVVRNDDRLKVFAEYDVNFSSYAFAKFSLDYSDYQSNVAVQAYDQNIAKLVVGVRL